MVDGRRNDMSKDECTVRKRIMEDKYLTDVNTRGIHFKSGTGLNDVLASRRAEETANRRFEATKWLQKMVGSLVLSSEPSEEELKLCLRNGLVLCILVNKIHPGAVPKIVETPIPANPNSDGALSAYQYFENLRNFLVAMENLKLPSFEASDLEQGSCLPGSTAKVVDCILALKLYSEWRDSGALGLWKYSGGTVNPDIITVSSKGNPGSVANGKLIHDTSVVQRSSGRQRKRWTFSDLKSLMAAEFQTDNGFAGRMEKVYPIFHVKRETSPIKVADAVMDMRDSALNPSITDSRWINYISEKFREPLQVNAKCSQDVLASDCSANWNGASQSLSNLVTNILSDKTPAEIPVLVEAMLRKVVEEFEHHLVMQNKHTCKKERQFPRGKLLETLVAGSTKELKNMRRISNSMREDFLDMQTRWQGEIHTLKAQLEALSVTAQRYHKVLAENRKLYNEVQDLKGNIRVYCRVRPSLVSQGIVDYIGENGDITLVNPSKQGKEAHKTFHFTKVFGNLASQEEVFQDTQPMIRSVLDGFNVCIFAYGQTGSGKTYTMSGPDDCSKNLWGVNYRALNDLFEISQNRKNAFRYEVRVQMIEIYNEQVKDLLVSDGIQKRYPF